jgi:arginase
MNLHVVEIAYQDGEEAPERGREAAELRRRGAYAAVAGGVQVQIPSLPEADRTGDVIADLGRVCGQVATAVERGLKACGRVAVVGGNCSHLPGVIGGMQRALGSEARLGLIWFDAHGDFNTPRTTLTGRLGGMPVAVAAGLCHAPWRALARQTAPLPTDRIVMYGVRNLDPEEEQLIRATDIRIVPGEALAEAASRLAQDCDAIDLHIDLDVLDAALGPTLPTREPDGPGVTEVVAAAEAVLGTGKVAALSLVAIFASGPGQETTLESAFGVLSGTVRAWPRIAG